MDWTSYYIQKINQNILKIWINFENSNSILLQVKMNVHVLGLVGIYIKECNTGKGSKWIVSENKV